MFEKVIDFVKKHKKGCVAVVTVPVAIVASIIANSVGIDVSFSFGGDNLKSENTITPESKERAATSAILSITEKAKRYSYGYEIVRAARDIRDIALTNSDNNTITLQAIKSLGELADLCVYNHHRDDILKLIKEMVTNQEDNC